MDELRRALDAIAERTDDEEVVVLVAEARTAMQRAALAARSEADPLHASHVFVDPPRSEPGAEGLDALQQFENLAASYGFNGDRAAGAWLELRLAIKRLAATPTADSRGLDVERLREAARRAGLPDNVTVADIENLAREYDRG